MVHRDVLKQMKKFMKIHSFIRKYLVIAYYVQVTELNAVGLSFGKFWL